ncbi:MAG: general stress protein CsbD [Chitinophagaceae bacterium]|nr:general stress protein CsbD [Chitinophagaceae bacterium]MBL0337183.1 general stress protein CsbD [Chitinophagaceae bacterium]
MTTPTLQGNWNNQKGKLKKKYAVLEDSDLIYQMGKKEEMLERIQIKLGKTKEELRVIIEAL